MRLSLDEMLSPLIAEQLRNKGHDVESIKGDRSGEARSDRDIMDLARSEHRAVVTNDVGDFRRLHHEAILGGGPGQFGMVFMSGGYRRTKADIGRIVAALEALLGDHSGERDLADREAWL